MSLSIQMRFDEAKDFFANTQLPADNTVTLLFDDVRLVNELKKQQFMTAIESLRGSVKSDLLGELLAERAQDRKAETRL